MTAQALAALVRRLFRRQEPPPPRPRLPPSVRGRQQTARMTPDEVSAELDRIAATFEGHGDPPDFRDDDTRMGLIWEPPRRRRYARDSRRMIDPPILGTLFERDLDPAKRVD